MTATAQQSYSAARRRELRRIARRLARNPLSVVGAVLALAFVIMAVAAPWLAPTAPGFHDFDAVLEPPSAEYPFGTDELGRDIFSRTIWGARASMTAGVLATAIALVVAIPIGVVAGYRRGVLDSVVMRVNDAMLAFPFLILAVGLSAILGPSLRNAALAIGLAQAPKLVRVARGEALRIREMDFIGAAVLGGSSSWRIQARYVLPNMTNTLIVQATILVPYAIIAESILSFLGLGVQPPVPSWGVMLNGAQPFLERAPWMAVFPGLAIFFATLSFNLLGDGLRDVLDPRHQP